MIFQNEPLVLIHIPNDASTTIDSLFFQTFSYDIYLLVV